jgi:hypothetical protein
LIRIRKNDIFYLMKNSRKAIIIGSVFLGLILFSLFFISLTNKFFPRQDVPTIKEGSIIAENWIRNHSFSFPFYGKDLKLIEQNEITRGEYEFLFSFLVDKPEYGVQQNKMLIKTKNTEIVGAIRDEIFDEIKGKYIEKTETIKLYFVIKEDEEDKVKEIERVVTSSILDNLGVILIEELLRGPDEKETERGYFSYIEPETSLISFEILNGTAYLEFSIGFDQQLDIAKEQIKKTLSQISEIKEVRAPERKSVIVVVVEGVPEDFLFTRDLKEGDKGIDVKYLQIILNADPDTAVAQKGPGSPGEEREVFDQATTRAVKAFQRKYADEILRPAGLILSNGIASEHTRDKLNAILEENRW